MPVGWVEESTSLIDRIYLPSRTVVVADFDAEVIGAVEVQIRRITK